MSSPPNDTTDHGRIIPLTTDTPAESASAPAHPSAAAALGTPPIATEIGALTPDPLATLQLRPQIVEALSTIFDPEIPVNIYELGLIYDILVAADNSVEIRMTMTAPACPAAQILPVQVEQRVRDIPGVTRVHVEIVWDPPWTKDRMSEAAKLQLGMF